MLSESSDLLISVFAIDVYKLGEWTCCLLILLAFTTIRDVVLDTCTCTCTCTCAFSTCNISDYHDLLSTALPVMRVVTNLTAASGVS